MSDFCLPTPVIYERAASRSNSIDVVKRWAAYLWRVADVWLRRECVAVAKLRCCGESARRLVSTTPFLE